MKKKSSAVKMASGTAMITPAISARTPASAFSGGNTGSRWLPETMVWGHLRRTHGSSAT